MDYRETQERRARSKRRWNFIGWGLVIFGISSPIGFGVLIANWLDLLPNIGGSVDLTRAVNRMPVQNMSAPPRQEPEAVVPKKAKKETGIPKNGGLITAIGAIASALFAIGGISELLTLFEEGFSFTGLINPIVAFCFSAAGLVTALFGHVRKKKAQRFENYLKLIGDKTAVPIHYLADVMGIDYHKVIKDLREMISRGILTPAWLDLKTYRLMRTEYTEAQAVQPEEKKEEALSRNDRILRQIRADNDLIADVEVSAKIDRIEDLTRKIFAILEERPEKEAQLYNFMNYYLPTTLKALESYARLEAQGVETAAIREAKQKINKALDELADGYEKQLDKLFEDDVVDITADIDVMRKMLQKDGLKEDEIISAVTGGKG